MSHCDGPGIYVPDNPALEDVLARCTGQGFRLDHARLFLHWIAAKRWMHNVDEDGFARLNDSIMRQYIPRRALGPLKKSAISGGVLLTSPHSAGNHAKGYQIAPSFDGLPRRHVVQNARLARKIIEFRARYKLTNQDPGLQAIVARRQPLLNHLRTSLEQLSLPDTPEAMMAALAGQVDPGHVAYVTQCIKYRDHDGLTVDGFGYRVHSLITMTSSEVRSRLLLGQRSVAEVDVANSQPLLLAVLLQESRKNQVGHTKRRPGEEGEPWGGGLPPSIMSRIYHLCRAFQPFVRALPSKEIRSFRSACVSGELYDLLAQDAGLERPQAKRELFRDVLFGKPHVRGRLTHAFGRRWPNMLESIREAKRQLGYKSIAQALQRLESTIMLDGIAFRMLEEFPGVPFLTIHDSALLVAASAQQVRDIMLEEFARWGVVPTIRIKSQQKSDEAAGS